MRVIITVVAPLWLDLYFRVEIDDVIIVSSGDFTVFAQQIMIFIAAFTHPSVFGPPVLGTFLLK